MASSISTHFGFIGLEKLRFMSCTLLLCVAVLIEQPTGSTKRKMKIRKEEIKARLHALIDGLMNELFNKLMKEAGHTRCKERSKNDGEIERKEAMNDEEGLGRKEMRKIERKVGKKEGREEG